MPCPLSIYSRRSRFWDTTGEVQTLRLGQSLGLAQSVLSRDLWGSGIDPPKINQEGATMHSLAFILSIIGFGLELTAFLMTVAIL
jgi:hypothetical protein